MLDLAVAFKPCGLEHIMKGSLWEYHLERIQVFVASQWHDGVRCSGNSAAQVEGITLQSEVIFKISMKLQVGQSHVLFVYS